MALISLPLHWTSEGENRSSNGRHRLPGNSILISLPITKQRKRRQKLWLCPLIFLFPSIFPSYWFSALCEECKFVMKVTRMAFLIELKRAWLGAVEIISINCARLGLIFLEYDVLVCMLCQHPKMMACISFQNIHRAELDCITSYLNGKIVGSFANSPHHSHGHFRITCIINQKLSFIPFQTSWWFYDSSHLFPVSLDTKCCKV